MPYLVDGDKLPLTCPRRPRTDAERSALALELDRFSARQRKRLVVVFDGTPPPGRHLGPDVHFAGPGRTADDLILSLLRREEDRRGWIVITSDRPLGDRCRHLEARVERSDLFRKRLSAGTHEEKPEREDDVDYWLRQFGD